ncbi:unnamed protein product [Urochloa humidicola]
MIASYEDYRSYEFDNFEILSMDFQVSVVLSNSKASCGFFWSSNGIETTTLLILEKDGEFFIHIYGQSDHSVSTIY